MCLDMESSFILFLTKFQENFSPIYTHLNLKFFFFQGGEQYTMANQLRKPEIAIDYNIWLFYTDGFYWI